MEAVRPELIGREREQAAIAAFLAFGEDRPRALLLEGDAGIGKTTLWKAALSSAAAMGYRLLSSAPTQAETGLPYAVLGDLLDPIPEEAVASLSEPLQMALEVALFRMPARQAPADQFAVSTAFLRVLRYLAAERPVMLAVDDLQWADGPSMRVLAFAIHRLDQDRVKLLTALRLPAGAEAASSLAQAVGHRQFERLSIGPLSPTAIDDLLLERLERPLRKPELDQVNAVSAGNPFFALEIGRFILDRPTTVRVGEPMPLPGSLTDAIKGRIEKLPAHSRRLLLAVAALSRPDETLILRTDPQAATALDAALGAQVIERTDGRLRFTHPLLASVVYSLAAPAVRRNWHAMLAQLVTDTEERARHLALSTIGPDAAVADAVEQAAISANARGAPDAASTLAQRAAELTPPAFPELIERRRILSADYRLRAGDAPGARALLEAVLQTTPSGQQRAEALRLLGGILFTCGDLVEAERLLTEALSQVGDDAHTEALVERDLVHALGQQGNSAASLEHSRRLSDLARRSDDPWVSEMAMRTQALSERHAGMISPVTRERARAVADGRIAIGTDASPGRLHPVMEWAVILKWSDDFARARTLFKRALLLTDGRDDSVRAPILFHLAEMESWAGDWLLAAVYADECAKSVIHAGQRAYERLPLILTALLASYRGDLAAARRAAGDALAIATSIGDEPYRRRALAILGSTELAAGDPSAANSYFEELRARARGSSKRFSGVVRSEGDEVETLLALGRTEEAEATCADLAADEERLGDPWQHAIGARCRALLAVARGELADAVPAFEEALAAHDLLPMPLERARTHLSYARALRRMKQKRLARAQIEAALGTFTSLGATAWIMHAESELSRIAPQGGDLLALTPTEARVAELVASGRTNKEVAAALFLSVKTIESNLSRVYDKLKVRSRSELVAHLASHASPGGATRV